MKKKIIEHGKKKNLKSRMKKTLATIKSRNFHSRTDIFFCATVNILLPRGKSAHPQTVCCMWSYEFIFYWLTTLCQLYIFTVFCFYFDRDIC